MVRRTLVDAVCLACCFFVCLHRTYACGGPVFYHHFGLQTLCEAVITYERNHDEPLASGPQWAAPLNLGDETRIWRFTIGDDGAVLSPLGMRIVYDPAGAIRDVGPNGIDEGGAGDDWEARFDRTTGAITINDPDWGAWYPNEYASLRLSAVVRGLTVVLLGLGVGAMVRRALPTVGVVTLSFGVLFLTIHPDGMNLLLWPAWMHPVEVWAGVSLAITAIAATVWVLVWAVRAIERLWPWRMNPDVCQNCFYDLAGLPAGGPCPECGNAVERHDLADTATAPAQPIR